MAPPPLRLHSHKPEERKVTINPRVEHSLCLSVCLSLSLPLCLSVCLSVCLSPSVCLSVCLSVSLQRELVAQMSGPIKEQTREQANPSSYQHPVKMYLGRFLKPYFKDKLTGLGPPANQETKERNSKMSACQDYKNLKMKRWNGWQKTLLIHAVTRDHLRRLTQPKLSRGKTEEELIGDRYEDHDWDKISNVDFEGTREASDLHLFWQNFLHPSINKSSWSREEVQQLGEISRRHQERDWEAVAQELGTNRTAFMCLQTFQRFVSRSLRHSSWSPEEDTALRELVERMRIGNYIPYTQMSYFMEGRGPDQLMYRWSQVLDPSLRKGAWSKEEDELLLHAVSRHGEKNWWKIRLEVPGRTDGACRDRYLDCLKAGIRKGPFDQQERNLLLLLVRKHGVGRWAKIAAEIPNRFDAQCMREWRKMTRVGLTHTHTHTHTHTYTHLFTVTIKKWQTTLILLSNHSDLLFATFRSLFRFVDQSEFRVVIGPTPRLLPEGQRFSANAMLMVTPGQLRADMLRQARRIKDKQLTSRRFQKSSYNNLVCEYKLMAAVTPWIGNMMIPAQTRTRQTTRQTAADALRQRAENIQLSSTPIFLLLLQTLNVDMMGCKEVIEKKKKHGMSWRPPVPPYSSPSFSKVINPKTMKGLLQQKAMKEEKQPQTPSQQPQIPSQQPQTPSQKPQTPSQQPQTPSQQPQTPSQTPSQQPQTPSQQPQTPSQQPQTPSQQPQAPSQQPQAPSQQPQTPSQQPQTPSQQPQTPSQQPQTQSQQPQTPSQQPQTPSQQPQTPSQQPQTQFQQLQPPSQQPATPSQEPQFICRQLVLPGPPASQVASQVALLSKAPPPSLATPLAGPPQNNLPVSVVHPSVLPLNIMPSLRLAPPPSCSPIVIPGFELANQHTVPLAFIHPVAGPIPFDPKPRLPVPTPRQPAPTPTLPDPAPAPTLPGSHPRPPVPTPPPHDPTLRQPTPSPAAASSSVVYQAPPPSPLPAPTQPLPQCRPALLAPAGLVLTPRPQQLQRPAKLSLGPSPLGVRPALPRPHLPVIMPYKGTIRPDPAVPPPLRREALNFDPSLMFKEPREAVLDWLSGRKGVVVAGLDMALPYLPPFVSSLNTLSTLLCTKKALTRSALHILPQNQEEQEEEECVALVRQLVAERFATNPAYQLLKARFLSCFTVPALLATIEPTGRSSEPRPAEEEEEQEEEQEEDLKGRRSHRRRRAEVRGQRAAASLANTFLRVF
uniref:Small nuclear RNA activating complex, polypeptide 4 n=1 Tax=Myripristis murdjan TaxID=586833 RepID=A0A667X2L0_9TELE